MEESSSPIQPRPEIPSEISSDLRKVLNSHGFGFQYAVVRQITELSESSRGRFRLEGTEIPVGPAHENTHVDVVIETIGEFQTEECRYFLIGECKRVDLARSRWCFAKSPYTWPDSYQTDGMIQFDRLYEIDGDDFYKADTAIANLPQNALDLGFELKTREKGTGIGGSGKSEISSAVTQVLRGVKGFIHHLNGYDFSERSAKLTKQAYFIPVLFTTAEIFTTNLDISTANIQDGNLLDEEISIERADWLWFNYNRSLTLSHELLVNYDMRPHLNRHYLDFSRSIAIVNPRGIESFLELDFYRLLDRRRGPVGSRLA